MVRTLPLIHTCQIRTTSSFGRGAYAYLHLPAGPGAQAIANHGSGYHRQYSRYAASLHGFSGSIDTSDSSYACKLRESPRASESTDRKDRIWACDLVQSLPVTQGCNHPFMSTISREIQQKQGACGLITSPVTGI